MPSLGKRKALEVEEAEGDAEAFEAGGDYCEMQEQHNTGGVGGAAAGIGWDQQGLGTATPRQVQEMEQVLVREIRQIAVQRPAPSPGTSASLTALTADSAVVRNRLDDVFARVGASTDMQRDLAAANEKAAKLQADLSIAKYVAAASNASAVAEVEKNAASALQVKCVACFIFCTNCTYDPCTAYVWQRKMRC